MDDLIARLRASFSQIPDHRRNNSKYSLVDYLMTGFAMFSLKDPSLRFYVEQFPQREENLRRIFGIECLPGDTALREGLDGIEPAHLHRQFGVLVDYLDEHDLLAQRRVLGKYLAISIDGTGHYSSSSNSCPHCLVTTHRNGTQTFHHQLLAAVNVCPGQSTVFTFGCEAIVKQDGQSKNDCERNAANRLLPRIRQVLPQQPLICIFDALYASGPHIRQLAEQDMRYIIGLKGDNFVEIQLARSPELLQQHTWQQGQRQCRIGFATNLILNGANQDIRVNYLRYEEVDKRTGKRLFYGTWITDLPVNESNVKELVALARARWKIENETFNTLKNQGYHFGHNYGHGKEYLATNLGILTLLAFCVDQILQHADENFQKALQSCSSRKFFWELIRQIFYMVPAKSMDAIYRFAARRRPLDMPAIE